MSGHRLIQTESKSENSIQAGRKTRGRKKERQQAIRRSHDPEGLAAPETELQPSKKLQRKSKMSAEATVTTPPQDDKPIKTKKLVSLKTRKEQEK